VSCDAASALAERRGERKMLIQQGGRRSGVANGRFWWGEGAAEGVDCGKRTQGDVQSAADIRSGRLTPVLEI
jgi:hypothetical protein